ncbi:MAG: PAS domain S-box protein, partial [Pseudomonadota bacterium]
MNRNFPDQSQLSEDDLQGIIGLAPVGMIVSDVEGKFIYVNSALMDLLGYDHNEIYRVDLVVTSSEDLGINQQIRQRLLEGRDQTVVMEKRYLHKSGRSILCLVSIAGLRNKNNQIDRFVEQIIDIEYRKKMEKSADLFRSIINASRDAMYIIDPNTGKILDANLHSCELLGYSYEEMLEMYVADIEVSLST